VEHKQNVQKQAKIKKKKRSVTKICFAIEQKQQKTHKKYRKECSKSKRSDSNKTVNKIFGFHQFFAALSLFFFFFLAKEVGQKLKEICNVCRKDFDILSGARGLLFLLT